MHPNKSNAQVFLDPSLENWSGILEQSQLEFDPDKKYFEHFVQLPQLLRSPFWKSSFQKIFQQIEIDSSNVQKEIQKVHLSKIF